MKQTKKFFDTNRLNKGYSNEQAISYKNDNSMLRKKYEHILPPIDVISEYEELAPGTLSKLISMAEDEQNHRHKMELKAADDAMALERISRRSVFWVMIVLSLASISMVMLTSFIYGMIFFGLSLLFITSINFVQMQGSSGHSSSDRHRPKFNHNKKH